MTKKFRGGNKTILGLVTENLGVMTESSKPTFLEWDVGIVQPIFEDVYDHFVQMPQVRQGTNIKFHKPFAKTYNVLHKDV